MFPVSDRAIYLSHVYLESTSPIIFVALVTLGVRLYIRIKRARKLGIDDMFILLGTVSGLPWLPFI